MSRNRAQITSLNESMMRAMSMMDGQDSIPRASESQSRSQLPMVAAALLSSSSTSESQTLTPPSPDLSEYSALREYMGGYSAYFDSSVPEEQRLQWAVDNLPEDFQKFEQKRLKFEEEREAWTKEMEALKAQRLLILRKEVVRLWMHQEERAWAESRESWVHQKRMMEEMLKADLDKLTREASNARGGNAVAPVRVTTYRNRLL